MRLEIVKVHLFKKELKYILINSLIKIKFLSKIRRGAVEKLTKSKK